MSGSNLIFEIKGKKCNILFEKDVNNSNKVIFIDYQKDKKSGDKTTFPRVLNFGDKFGKPYLENASVIGEVIKHRKLKKIVVFKYKAKKRTTKKQGHRPRYTEVKILSVEGL